MSNLPESSSPLRALLSIRTEAFRVQLKAELEKSYPEKLRLTDLPALPEAIALIKKDPAAFDLIVFEYAGPNSAVLKPLFDLCPTASFIMISPDQAVFEGVGAIAKPPEFILNSDLAVGFGRTLKKLAATAKIPPLRGEDEEGFLVFGNEALLAVKPLSYDVYVRMGGAEGRYVCLFKKGVVIELEDLEKYSKKRPDFFYVKKSESNAALLAQSKEIDAMAAKSEVSMGDAQKQFTASVASVRDVVNRMGFTAEAQTIAKSSVNMALKALGSKPKLSVILDSLNKKKNDEYLVSHSFMVGQVSCALAHKLGWNSPSTFLKLSLAGFLHDLSLTSEKLAYIESLSAAETSGKWSDAEIQQVKFHTVKSAEYSKQFSEIPSDVDQIIAQHHERPDGTGFPRTMPGSRISPLSALFIMAHDLVHAIYESDSVNTETYFEERAELYQVGQFKKILTGLKNPVNA